MFEALMTKGTSCCRCGIMILGLLRVAEFNVVKATRRFSISESLSMVVSIWISIGFKTSSNASSVSLSANRTAWIAMPRTEGMASLR